MNAAIRAVVRQGTFRREWKCLVSMTDMLGIVAGEIHPLDAASVGDIISRGGTFLHPARLPRVRPT